MISLRKLINWGVVQPAERVAVNHEVAGSSPAAPAIDKKGEEMSTQDITALQDQLALLRARINELVDELATLKNELSRFKSDVASDVKYLTDRVDG
tara:strand:- start:490 stop:777 length:288 start_codon:yes stop_codon:yes gene_type:complete